MVVTETVHIASKGNTDIIDLTRQAAKALESSGLTNGILTVSVTGSTASLSTCEYEPGLRQDLKDFFNRIAPPGNYHHHETWNDDNGHSHVRATLVGPSVVIPFINGQLRLGTWQQIILIDFDTRPRDREITFQMLGE